MKLKTYRILYTISLCVSTVISIIGAIFTVYSIVNGLNPESDNFILPLCFIVLLIFSGFQIYCIIRSMSEGSIFFRSIIENQKKQLNTNLLLVLNVLLLFLVFIFIYAIILASGIETFLSQFPLVYDILIICFTFLCIVNIVFFDLYTLVYKQEK